MNLYTTNDFISLSVFEAKAGFLDMQTNLKDWIEYHIGPMIKLKRVYERYDVADGKRVLVDRLWPRGIRRSASNVEIWLKDIAPSNELRKWFSHDPAKWEGFRRRYTKELEGNERAVEKLLEVLHSTDTVTFVYAAKDEMRNNAVALKEFLKERFGLR